MNVNNDICNSDVDDGMSTVVPGWSVHIQHLSSNHRDTYVTHAVSYALFFLFFFLFCFVLFCFVLFWLFGWFVIFF